MKRKKRSSEFFSRKSQGKAQRQTRQTIVPAQSRPHDEPGVIPLKHHELWYAHYRSLSVFKKRFGHCLVPENWAADPRLAAWVRYQRHRASSLSHEKYMLLDKLGFVWNSSEYRWMTFYVQLLNYHKQNDSYSIGSSMSQNRSLTAWMARQRSLRRWNNPALTPEHIRLLDEISFSWDAGNKKVPVKGT